MSAGMTRYSDMGMAFRNDNFKISQNGETWGYIYYRKRQREM